MKRFVYVVAVGVIFASVIGCAHKKAKRFSSACYADCCGPCSCCDGIAGPINGAVVPGPIVSSQPVGAVPGPVGRSLSPASTSLDVTNTAAATPASVRR
jgi:hypothetical protein